MVTFLIKFTACLFVFWLVYYALLERQKNHNFKRFYLIGTLVVSAIIPLLTITEYIEPLLSTNDIATAVIPFEPILTNIPVEIQEPFNWSIVLWTLYGIGAALFGLRFISNLFNLYVTINNHEQLSLSSFIYVLLDHYRTPHSFFRYIFLNKDKFNANDIPKEVLIHEETHAKQWHSADILLIELVQIIFWFHPMIYILKYHIKLNHEFLADHAVINQGIATKNYQHILLQFSSSTFNHKLASAINYSSFKKRFTVMKTQTSKTRIWLSTILLLPIIAVLFYSFAEKDYVEKETTDIVDPIKETLENHNTHYDLSAEDQKIPKTILTLSINQKEELLINGDLGDLKSLEKVLQDLKVPQNYTINVEGEKQSSPEIMKGVLTLIKNYDLLLNSSKIQLPKTEQKASYNPTFLEYILEMEEKGASFFLDGKKITAEQAKSIAKNNNGKQTEMLTQKDANGNIIVKLSSQQNPPTAKEVAEYNTWAKSINQQMAKANTSKNVSDYPIVKIKEVNKYRAIYDMMTVAQKKGSEAWPNFPPPPPPPPPPAPLEHIKEMVQKGATFYYEGKAISSKDAIDIVSKNQNLNIKVEEITLQKPRVYIYKY